MALPFLQPSQQMAPVVKELKKHCHEIIEREEGGGGGGWLNVERDFR